MNHKQLPPIRHQDVIAVSAQLAVSLKKHLVWHDGLELQQALANGKAIRTSWVNMTYGAFTFYGIMEAAREGSDDGVGASLLLPKKAKYQLWSLPNSDDPLAIKATEIVAHRLALNLGAPRDESYLVHEGGVVPGQGEVAARRKKRLDAHGRDFRPGEALLLCLEWPYTTEAERVVGQGSVSRPVFKPC